MSLPLSHAGGSVDGISAALDLRFASSLSLTSTSGITPSFSRASTGTFFNSSGVLTTAAVNGPRFNHVYNGSSWVSKGLLVEEQRTNLTAYSEQFDNAYWSKTRMTVSANSVIGPDNQTTADLVYPSTGIYSFVERSLGTISYPASYTLSIFLKYAGKRWAYIYGPNGSYVTFFDVQNGVIGTVAPQATLASITNVGNGWYRCVAAYDTVGAAGYCVIGVSDSDGAQAVTGSGTDGVYVWGSQLELGAFPTSYIPTTTAAVTRSADVCQITGGDFTSFWNASEGSFVTEADSIGFATTGSDRYIVAFNSSGTQNIAHAIFLPTTGLSFDVYNSTLQARVSYTQPNAGVLFKLASAYKANDFAATLNGSAVQTDTSGTVPTINNVGIGHYPSFNQYANCHISRLRYFNKRLTNNQLEDLCKPEEQLKLDLNFSSNLSLTPTVGPTPSYSRASTGTYFNASGVLTSAAINGPRFDHVYDGSSWVSKGLLIEEARTNICLYSEQFNDSSYAKNNCTVTANSIASPDGLTTADTLTATASTAIHYLEKTGYSVSTIANTISIFAKYGTHRYLQLSANNESSGVFGNFDLVSGVVGSVGASTTSQITNVGSGWYRCSITYTATNTASRPLVVLVSSSTAARVESNTLTAGDYLYLWGCQQEAGSFPTSYIPTTTAAVTRSADVCQITGGDFSGFWNASEGTISLEQDLLSYSDPAADQRYFSIAGSSNSPAFILNYDNGTNFFWYRNFSGLDQLVLPDVNSAFKVALAFRTNDYATVLNGGTPVTSSTKTLPTTFTKMDIGYQVGSTARSSWIQRLRYYAIRLPNRLLIAKST